MGTKAKKIILSAQDRLNEAKQELLRPKEDIVSFLVCKNSQYAIENYLKGYLIKNGVDIEDCCSSVENLYNQCLVINKNFENVNLSDFLCKGENLDNRFCNDVSVVSKCYDAAERLDAFLRKEKIIY